MQKETKIFVTFVALYFLLLVWQSENYLITWDEGGHLSNGVFVHEGLKKLLDTGSIQETIAYLQGLSERCRCFILLHYPPMFYLLEGGLAFGILGVNEFAGRLIPMLFSIGALLITYKIGKLLYNDDGRVGFVAAVLLAASPQFFKYSMMVMMDTGTVFFLLLVTYFFLLLMKGKTGPLVLGIAWGAAFLYRYEAVFLIPAFGICALLMADRKRLRNLCFSFVLAILMAAPWAAITLLRQNGSGNSEFSWWLSILFTGTHRQGTEGLDLAYFAGILPYQMSTLIAVIGASGILYWVMKKRKPESEKMGLTLIILAATIYIFFSFSPTRSYRHVLTILPVLAIFGSAFMFSLSEKFGNQRIWQVGLIVVVFASALQYEGNLYRLDGYWSNYAYSIPQVEEAARYLLDNSRDGDYVLMSMIRYEIGPSTIPFYMLKYDPTFKTTFRTIQAFGINDTGPIDIEKFRSQVNADCPRFALALEPHKSNWNFDKIYKITAPFAQLFQKSGSFRLEKTFENPVADILIYERSSDGCI